MSIRIGLDFRSALTEPCGIGRYAQELSRGLLSLREEFDLVLYAATRFGQLTDRIPRAIREHPKVTLVERRFPAKVLKALSFLPGFDVKRITGPLALLHHTDLTYLPVDGVPEVLTVHDLAFEISEQFHEQSFRRRVGPRLLQAIERARVLIVPSVTTKNDLMRLYEVSHERIHVVPHGSDHVLRPLEETDGVVDRTILQRLSKGPYLLTVGTIEPRKNLPRLLRAFARVAARHTDLELVFAGAPGWRMEAFEAALGKHPHQPRIHVLGSVNDATLRELYKHCIALVYPSLYEGFGLPVAEAMALGTPVVTSARSSTEEIASGAAVLVDPDEVESIAEGIERIVSDDSLRRTLRGEGITRAHSLTWNRAARETYAVYRKVLMGQEASPPRLHGMTEAG